MQQWHPFAFRYLVLAAPWIAIVAAWGIEKLGPIPRVIGWTLALAASFNVGWHITTRTHQAGWTAAVHPERSFGFAVMQSWRGWSQQLDQPTKPFTIALTDERPITAFYRQDPARDVFFLPNAGQEARTAEELVRDQTGWVIVSALRFIGREGNVAAKTWLQNGEEGRRGSIAAYRRLAPNENPQPVLYRRVGVQRDAEFRYDLLVKTWNAETVRLRLINSAPTARDYTLVTPLGRSEGRLGAGASAQIETKLGPNAVTQVAILFRAAPEVDPAAEPRPAVELITP
jgi:hypothetical protein